MPNFTYDGFLTAASNAGLLGEFSQADLDTARKYPGSDVRFLTCRMYIL